MKNNNYIRGRGAQKNLRNKYENFYVEPETNNKTTYKEIEAKSILSKVKSPDVCIEYSLNPYLGCEHGCVYCYARNSHNYWGWNAGLSFEQNIIVKTNAPDLLRKEFDKKSWKSSVITISGNTDCYQIAERKYKLTREILKVCLEYRNPVTIITKNALILRDIDILQELAKLNLIHVNISITSSNEELLRKMEPRTSAFKKRLNAITKLREARIPVRVMIAPIIPGLNDFEIPELLKLTAQAGALDASYTIVRLNDQIGEIFTDWIKKAFPLKANKVLILIKQCHQGKLNDSRWFKRMQGDGIYSNIIAQTFDKFKKKYYKKNNMPPLRLDLFRRPYQRSLWE